MRHQGKIIKWIDEKGFGFIAENGSSSKQIFVHISGFKSGERPSVGENVSFEIADDVKKGMQAYNVIYLDRQSASIKTRKIDKKMPAAKSGNQSGTFVKILGLVLVGVFVFQNTDILSSVYKGDEPAVTSVNYVNSGEEPINKQNFQCAGKTRCSQMISCEEAVFYLKNCPGTITDGDHDGNPCEDQWCGH